MAEQNATPSGTSHLSRRSFIGGSVATVGMAATGGGYLLNRSRRSAGNIAVANWPYYLDEGGERRFETATKLDITYKDVVNDNSEFTESLRPSLEANREVEWDVVVLTDWMAANWIFNGWATRFDLSKLPNRLNLDDSLAAPSYDPSRRYTLPWTSGMTGIAYNAEKVPAIRGIEDVLTGRMPDEPWCSPRCATPPGLCC